MQIGDQSPKYRDEELFFDSCHLQTIAQKYPTPFYIYSQNIIEANIREYQKNLGDRNHLICFSVKSNSNLSILKLVGDLACGADIVSLGELYRCQKANIPAHSIVFSGVGKKEDEIRYALEKNLMLFSIESEQELYTVERIARQMNVKANTSIRVNPNVDAQTHPYISTGLSQNKFGIAEDLVDGLYRHIQGSDALNASGIGFHIGSQLTALEGYKEAATKVRPRIESLLKGGIKLEYIDCGGGLGIQYDNEQVPSIGDYIRTFTQALPFPEQKLIFEPGRSIVGNAGLILGKTLYTKTNNAKHFTITDTAMNDIIRPALYNGYHKVLPLQHKADQKIIQSDVVGPVCESGDFIAKDREIPEMQSGDYFAILSAGAYCASMASHYNSRPKGMELLIQKDGIVRIIRKAESLQNLLQLEEDCL